MSASKGSTLSDKSQLSAPDRSPRIERKKEFRHTDSESSDSDASEDSGNNNNSDLYTNSVPDVPVADLKSTPIKGQKSRKSRLRRQWEILEGLKDGQRCDKKPEKFQGHLSKRRRWPLKGWHKRYFFLDNGLLYYAKSASDSQKGKHLGFIDIGLSVVAHKRQRRRVDIDAEELVYHIKMKDTQTFDQWLEKLRHHRLFRQHEIAFGTKETPRLTEITSPTEDLPPLTASLNLPEHSLEFQLKRELSRKSSIKGQDRVAAWVLDTQGFEQCDKELIEAQNLLSELSEELDHIRSIPFTAISSSSTDQGESENSDRKKVKSLLIRGGSKRKDHKRNSSIAESVISSPPNSPLVNDAPVFLEVGPIHGSASNPNLLSMESSRFAGLPGIPSHQQRIHEMKLQEKFLKNANKVHSSLKSLFHVIKTERDRLRQAVELNAVPAGLGTPTTVTSLKQTLTDVCKQNKELRARLSKIHTESSLSDLHLTSTSPPSPGVTSSREHRLLSMSMSADSVSEYHDAMEDTVESVSDTSSEHSDEASSDISDENDTELSTAHSASEENILDKFQTGRRSKLPVPKTDEGDVNLWNLLFRNIGKDLTKISMPVTLNEPLGMLQRLCEELEYSELLDKATEFDDPFERMVYVAAFAVSSYASSCYRAGYKPFNPLLGETYECVREDKGWRFIAEQVTNIRIKTKFWGKSMEIQPVGHVNLFLPKFNEHYKWNKVTTCVHNLLGGQRWVDQFGEMTISNGGIICKLTFTKASNIYQVQKRHEVFGHILNPEGKVVHHLFGKWNEALYCGQAQSARCIWRPGAMPDNHELYYGFTRFAIELNEILPDESRLLPPTDSRFRPDQRLLEEGNINGAEEEKKRVEHLQRERRKEATNHQSRWFKKVGDDRNERYEYIGKYWEIKKDPGFMKMTFVKLW
ncbi:hypothetical protein ACJMK2_015080 [Sinanodonta woodiana]|uniref:PH domain-containing protein n=1 Tax=Sinanodonta woodiana TaxID=1069815 RepID=A0ABD3V5K1_SINWO